MVSVVIPTYNRAHLIGRTIRSVLSQTYRDFEIIIVDDGSTDNTEDVVMAFGDQRIRYIRLNENSRTASVPRNKGIEAATGDYIAFLDSDDEWKPGKLEKQIVKFKSVSPGVGLVYTGYACFLEQTGETIVEYIPSKKGNVFQGELEGRIQVASHTILVRKECFATVGVFDVECLGSEDWDMLIRLAKRYEFDYVPEILAIYNIHGVQKSADIERQIQGYDRLLYKYQHWYSKKILSQRLQHIGCLCCYQGYFKRSRGYFAKAIKADPRDIYALIRFLLSVFAPWLYQSRLKRIRVKGAMKQGGIIFW
uniref:Putative glycosyltransferase n=1 Tax=viral metagenome TaxID=1070528 RepID=A0A6M3L529_9ZZZZ